MTHSRKTDLLDAFGYNEPPEKGANLAADSTTQYFHQQGKHQQENCEEESVSEKYRKRAAAALSAHCELVAGKEPKRFDKPTARGPLSVVEEKPKAKRTDLNKVCRNWMDKKGWKHYRADVWNSFAGVANDLFGIFDYLAFDVPTGTTIGIQVTSKNNMSARRKKMLASPWLPVLKGCGWRCVLVGFEKGANGRFEPKEEDL